MSVARQEQRGRALEGASDLDVVDQRDGRNHKPERTEEETEGEQERENELEEMDDEV